MLSTTFQIKQQRFSEYILNSCRLNLVCREVPQEFCLNPQDFKMKQQEFWMKPQQFIEPILELKMRHHTLRLSSLRFCMKPQHFKMKQQKFCMKQQEFKMNLQKLKMNQQKFGLNLLVFARSYNEAICFNLCHCKRNAVQCGNLN